MEHYYPINLGPFIDDFEDRETAISILNKFVTRSFTDLHQIRSGFESEKYRESHRLIHSLKGAAMNIGAPAMAQKAEAIEVIYKKNSFFEAGLPTVIHNELIAKLADLEKELKVLADTVSQLD
ncbi:MAG: Hpt domain-containing protein [Spirochaetales bacterium]|nr:Hpt domain-containing protein [Spirochaetales bacterium]